MNIKPGTTLPKYRVESVQKSPPPEGVQDGEWCSYVISEGNSKIRGYQLGSFHDVTQYVECVVDKLNMRAANCYSVYTSRKKK
ncbi:MAG: hypothetical protein OEZ68_06425 [Gammaproteobacteria bacterium]|nr:hypothetical protein [Gammaproteobacteria bacterium]MDH5800426.1 hypothetical protein [Gammaproteobacteria bacterium]